MQKHQNVSTKSADLSSGLQALGEATVSRLKLTPEQQMLLGNHLDSADVLDANVLAGSIDMPFSIPVASGRGALTTEKRTTAWVTITGYAQITAPNNGSWNITVTDIAQKRVVLNATGVTCGQQLNFSYKTGFSCQMQIVATWSEGKDTTLDGMIHANY